MLRRTLRRTTGTVTTSFAVTHSLGVTLDFWSICRFAAIGAVRRGYATRVMSNNNANFIRCLNTLQTACTIDVVCIVYQGHLY